MKPNESSTESVVSAFFAAVASGDADAIATLFADDIDWYVGGNPALPWTGTRQHRSDVAPYFRTLWPHFVSSESSSVIDQLIVSGTDAVVFATFKNKAASTGRAIHMPVVLHLRVTMGAIVMLHFYEDTWLVSSAFFPEAPMSST